jgi:uncharacterized membrane protein
MDEVVKKVASLGLPGVILVVTMATTGFTGTVALPIALAVLGGPFGMMGGLAVLGIVTLIGDALAGYGIEALLSKVYSERSKNEALGGILREIDGLPISDELKDKVKSILPKLKEDTDYESRAPKVTVIEE